LPAGDRKKGALRLENLSTYKYPDFIQDFSAGTGQVATGAAPVDAL